jgi:hypothetical protein
MTERSHKQESLIMLLENQAKRVGLNWRIVSSSESTVYKTEVK